MKTKNICILLSALWITMTIFYLCIVHFVPISWKHKSSFKESVVDGVTGLPSNLSAFDVIMKEEEKLMLLSALSALIYRLDLSNLTYILYGGSLLGAYRHGGLIPWDDDVDIWINNSQSEAVKRELNNIDGYKLYNNPNLQWKFFSRHSVQVENEPYNWPFIDILRFNENETHVWDVLEQYKDLFVYKKSDVFPLKTCKFENLYLNVPFYTEKVLTTNYDPEICSSAKYDHKTNQPIRKQRQVLPCKLLSLYYQIGPFCI